MTEIRDNIMEKLKCTECDSYLSCSPVMLKCDGGSVCGRCQPPSDDEWPAVRNNAYEELAAAVLFPCRYQPEGCTRRLPWDHVRHHEEVCDHRIYDCPAIPVGTCSWMGTHSRLFEHYKEAHPTLVLEHPCKLRPDISRDSELNLLMTVFGFLFMVQTKCSVTTGKLWYCVRYLGNSAFISNFEYSLEITNNNAILMKTKGVSPRERLIVNKSSSIEVSIKTLLEFLGGYDGVEFKITIRKKDSICFRCKRDLKPFRLCSIGERSERYHCINCRTSMLDMSPEQQLYLFRE